MSLEIKRNRVPCYNNTPLLIPAIRPFNVKRPVIENPQDYTVVVESSSIDVSQAALDVTPDYEILIFCDLKAPDTPPGLVFGPNFFRFPGELSSVEQFVRWLQDILVKKPQPYNLGLFDIDKEDFFRYSLNQTDYTTSFGSGEFTVSFNRPLALILSGFVNMELPEQAGGKLFYPMTPRVGINSAEIDTMYRLNQIESIIFRTTLPVTKTEFLDLELNNAVEYSILGTAEMNTFTYNIRTKSDWSYNPTVFRHYTMTQSGIVEQYDISIHIQYKNGLVRALLLAPHERFNVNIAFYPRQGVDV